MRHLIAGIASLAAISFGSPAQAADCATGMVCAGAPQSVVKALQDLGYKAQLTKDSDGDPMVTSGASGYDYDVLFYGCEKAANCRSLSFSITFKKDLANTADLANLWNNQVRFSTMSVTDKGSLVIQYDATTVGGLSKDNFGEIVGIWENSLARAHDFFAKHPATSN